MGKLYYTELGNIKDGINFNPCSPTGEVCFENIQRYGYWTSTTGFSGGDYIVTFRWSNALQTKYQMILQEPYGQYMMGRYLRRHKEIHGRERQ
jgi:hypothetical protein